MNRTRPDGPRKWPQRPGRSAVPGGGRSIEKTHRGSVIVGLLWCVAILSVLVVGVLHSATMDLRVVKNHGDLIQAHYLALAGIEKTKALLYLDARSRKTSAQNHSGLLFNSPQDFKDVTLGRGQFRIIRQDPNQAHPNLIYGVSDEESRLNANHASAEELQKLYGMTPEVAAAIIDYRDEDRTVTPGGAESEEYAAMQPPYLPRDGPFRTLREMLMVRGMPRDLLLGEDANQNGLLDPEENDGSASAPQDNQDGYLDTGWMGHITVDSAVRNVSAAGTARVNIKTAAESDLSAVEGLTSDLAKAIVEYRAQDEFESIADLLDVQAMTQQEPPPQQNPEQSGRPRQTGPAPRGGNLPAQNQPNQTSRPAGPKLISEDLFLEIADDLTVEDEQTLTGLVNINTAAAEVLECLPGLNKELAQAIVSYRQSSGYFANIAWLLRVPGMTRDLFKQVAPKVTARSETFRILSEGKVGSTGARKRLLAIVRIGSTYVDTLAFREDL